MMEKERNDSPSDSPLGDMGGDRVERREEREEIVQLATEQATTDAGMTRALLFGIWQTLEDINEALRESRRSPADDLVGEIAMEALRIYRPGDVL